MLNYTPKTIFLKLTLSSKHLNNHCVNEDNILVTVVSTTWRQCKTTQRHKKPNTRSNAQTQGKVVSISIKNICQHYVPQLF
jgi:hypothetical protein